MNVIQPFTRMQGQSTKAIVRFGNDELPGNKKVNPPVEAGERTVVLADGQSVSVKEPPIPFEILFKPIPMYTSAFKNALDKFPAQNILKALKENGWKIHVNPHHISKKTKEVSVSRSNKIIHISPHFRKEPGENQALALSYIDKGIAKAINHGALPGVKTVAKKHGWMTFTTKVSNNADFQDKVKPDGKMIAYRIALAIFGEDEAGDPTGENLFERCVSSYMRGEDTRFYDETQSQAVKASIEFVREKLSAYGQS